MVLHHTIFHYIACVLLLYHLQTWSTLCPEFWSQSRDTSMLLIDVLILLSHSAVEVSIQQAVYSIMESGGTVEVCVVLSGILGRDVTISLSTSNGSAVGKLWLSFSWICYYYHLKLVIYTIHSFRQVILTILLHQQCLIVLPTVCITDMMALYWSIFHLRSIRLVWLEMLQGKHYSNLRMVRMNGWLQWSKSLPTK